MDNSSEHNKVENPEELQRQKRWDNAEPIAEGTDESGRKFKTVPMSMLVGGKLKPTKVFTQPVNHLESQAGPTPRGWYKDKHSPKQVRPRPCYSEALLTTPYTGYCNVGCAFCYVDHGTRGYKATGMANANVNYPELMDKWLEDVMGVGAAYMSSFTEPFQAPLEQNLHVTQRLTEVFVKHGLPIFYLSRRLPPTWAQEALLKNPYSYMQWSINTSNEDDYRQLSPGSFSIQRLMQEVERFHKMGIYISFQINPILPGITSLEEVIELVRMIKKAGGNHCIFKFVEQVYSNRKLLFSRLRERKFANGEARIGKLDKMLTQTIGGVYTIAQDIRKEWLDALLKETRQLGITMSTCYEYYDNGAAGANLAPSYTTSDQCHGRAVPVFVKKHKGAPFEPLPGCYRKGCLYCAEFGTKACKDEILLNAQALSFKQMKSIRANVDPANWALKDSCPPPDKMNLSDWTAANPQFKTDAELWKDLGYDPEMKWDDRQGRATAPLPPHPVPEPETGMFI